MGPKIIQWILGIILSNLDPAVFAKLLVNLLRAIVGVLKDVFAKTSATWDDQIGEKLSENVEVIAKALNVP